MNILRIHPRDSLIARDGRPFEAGGGNRMHCLSWPYPSVLAGTLRTAIAKLSVSGTKKPFEDASVLERLKQVRIAGPFPLKGEQIYFPAPRDLVVYKEDEIQKTMMLRPRSMETDEGCNLPLAGLWPVNVNKDIKPITTPAFWSISLLMNWLIKADDEFQVPLEGEDVLENFEKDTRVHVRIDPEKSSAEEGMLFSTSGLVFRHDIGMSAFLETTDHDFEQGLKKLPILHPMGGERRLVSINNANELKIFPDKRLKKSLANAKGIRMLLVTPGIFNNGWLPDWIDQESLEGVVPSSNLKVRLRGACVDRWRPISGWHFEKVGKEKRTGPKAIRRLVPAGSVYFFETISGEINKSLDNIWLQSVSDDRQDQLDGFGLVVWGVWSI